MGSVLETAPLEDIHFVAFDTETTGLSPLLNRLVELSGVKFNISGEVVSTFSTLIDPEDDIPPDATAIHGITLEMVTGKPTYSKAVPEFFEWAGSGNVVLVAHNAQFDVGFLEVTLSKLAIMPPEHPIVDTLSLSRRLVPQARNHQLRTLAEHLELESGGYHRALADSYHVKDLLLRLLALMPQATRWSDLSAICQVLRFNDLSAKTLERQALSAQMHQINEAISAGSVVSIVYKGSQTGTRLVTPRSVHKWKGNVYLTAYCHSSDAERTFRLDKIECVEPQQEDLRREAKPL